ncbi:MAG TPA: NADH:flavin oxidoreductase [Phycisphaerae bacterium]|nr:NADH:flavin oxidoreductase [Phycisphaerae bacterium]
MVSAYPAIFSPLRIRGVELPNRIVVPPLVQVRPITSPEGLAWYRRLASGSPGMVIVEATNIDDFGRELTPETLRPLVDVIQQAGAAAFVQLFPGPLGRGRRPDDLTVGEIEAIIDAYGAAASFCRQAGFDGVEPHGAHSYLLHDFFKPDQNHRTDNYGGSLDNRCRMGVQIVRRMRQAAGADFLLGYRHTPTGAEYGIEESLVFAERLIEAGMDVLDVSPARKESAADLAEPFKKRLPVPVIAVGGMEEPDEAEAALREGRCDLVAVGRQMIADARWPAKVRQGRLDDIRKCTKCNKGCHGNLSKRLPVACVLWPEGELDAFG